ncbi:RNA polymerase subunit RPABC4/transcription elongation factor Spt4 [Clostridiales Family XIII bacterium PM5-7]
MNEKKMTKTCSVCGADIAKNAKVCPQCGGKNKKPIYRRGWFIAIIVIFVIGGIGGAMSGSDDSTPKDSQSAGTKTEAPKEEITYTQYKVDELMDDLDNNAASAADKYDDTYVEITGELSTIDSSGDYISLMPMNDDFAFVGVQCYIQDDEQLAQIKKLSKGDKMTIRGKITDVGEIMGYSLDIIKIIK